MPDGGTVSIFLLRCFAGAAAARGLDVTALLAELGLTAAALDDADLRVPAALAFRAFEEAARRFRDPDFGLHAAERLPLGAVGFLDYHARSSPTLGVALERTTRYFALVHDRTEVALELSGGVARLVWKARGGAVAPRQAAEFQLAVIVLRGRLLAGRDWPLARVEFARSAPADCTSHHRLFGATLLFDQPDDALVFDPSFLEQALPTADSGLSSVLERYAESLVARLPAKRSLLDEARRAVAELLNGGDPSLEATAARLGTSRRTLQRRLRDLGTSHLDLVDGVRRDLALRLLQDPALAITEIAYLLGFSEPAAFHHAFKRWTAMTPAEHRRSRVGRALLPPSSTRGGAPAAPAQGRAR